MLVGSLFAGSSDCSVGLSDIQPVAVSRPRKKDRWKTRVFVHAVPLLLNFLASKSGPSWNCFAGYQNNGHCYKFLETCKQLEKFKADYGLLFAFGFIDEMNNGACSKNGNTHSVMVEGLKFVASKSIKDNPDFAADLVRLLPNSSSQGDKPAGAVCGLVGKDSFLVDGGQDLLRNYNLISAFASVTGEEHFVVKLGRVVARSLS